MIAVEEIYNSSPACASSAEEAQAGEQPPLYEAALLLNLVGGSSPIPATETDWDALRKMAAENGVLSHAYHALIKTGVEIPDFFAQSVKEHEAAAMRRTVQLRNLLAAFANQQIDVLPLKGPALSLELYGNACWRSSHDLDLLVRSRDFSRAESLLIRMGFLPRAPRTAYDRKFYSEEDALMCELHFGLGDRRHLSIDADPVWSRAHSAPFSGEPAYAMSREDLALFLSCHAAKHRFARLLWVLDFAQSLQGWNDSEYESLLKLAQRSGTDSWLFLTCAALRALFPHLLPRALETRISSLAAFRCAENVVAQIFSGTPEHGIEDYRRLYAQMETNLWKRLCYCAGYFFPTEADCLWAREHRVPAQFAFALRPVRLLRKHGVHKILRTFFPQS